MVIPGDFFIFVVMSSHKHIIFFTESPESEDSKKLYDVVSQGEKPQMTMDDREYGMGWTEHFYIGGKSYTFFREPTNWEYFGIGEGCQYSIRKSFSDFKIIAKIDEQMDYGNPNKFRKKTFDSFDFISNEMGENSLYVLVFDDSSGGGIKYHKILDSWQGNFYDTKQNRDKKIKQIINKK